MKMIVHVDIHSSVGACGGEALPVFVVKANGDPNRLCGPLHNNNTHRSLCCEHGGSAMAK